MTYAGAQSQCPVPFQCQGPVSLNFTFSCIFYKEISSLGEVDGVAQEKAASPFAISDLRISLKIKGSIYVVIPIVSATNANRMNNAGI